MYSPFPLAELPPELLALVASHLNSLVDRQSFSSVCWAFRTAALPSVFEAISVSMRREPYSWWTLTKEKQAAARAGSIEAWHADFHSVLFRAGGGGGEDDADATKRTHRGNESVQPAGFVLKVRLIGTIPASCRWDGDLPDELEGTMNTTFAPFYGLIGQFANLSQLEVTSVVINAAFVRALFAIPRLRSPSPNCAGSATFKLSLSVCWHEPIDFAFEAFDAAAPCELAITDIVIACPMHQPQHKTRLGEEAFYNLLFGACRKTLQSLNVNFSCMCAVTDTIMIHTYPHLRHVKLGQIVWETPGAVQALFSANPTIQELVLFKQEKPFLVPGDLLQNLRSIHAPITLMKHIVPGRPVSKVILQWLQANEAQAEACIRDVLTRSTVPLRDLTIENYRGSAVPYMRLVVKCHPYLEVLNISSSAALFRPEVDILKLHRNLRVLKLRVLDTIPCSNLLSMGNAAENCLLVQPPMESLTREMLVQIGDSLRANNVNFRLLFIHNGEMGSRSGRKSRGVRWITTNGSNLVTGPAKGYWEFVVDHDMDEDHDYYFPNR